MTDIVARARAALEGATPGPWRVEWVEADGWWSIFGPPHDGMLCPEVATVDGRGENAEFIAQSPELVAELVAEVERLRSDPTLALMGSQLEKLAAERDQLKAEVERLRESGDRLAAMLDECASVIESAESERDELKAAVERVKRLANTNAIAERVRGRDRRAWLDLLAVIDLAEASAALDGDDGKGEA